MLLLVLIVVVLASCGKTADDKDQLDPENLAILGDDVIVTVDEFEKYLSHYSKELRASDNLGVESLFEQFARKKLAALETSKSIQSLSHPDGAGTASEGSPEPRESDPTTGNDDIDETAVLDRYERDKGRWTTRLVQLERYEFESQEGAQNWLRASRADESNVGKSTEANATELEWLSRTSADPHLRPVISRLSLKNRFSDAVPSGDKHVIYRLLAEQNNVPRPLGEVRGQILMELAREAEHRLLNQALDEIYVRLEINRKALSSMASRYAYEPGPHVIRVPVPGESDGSDGEGRPKTGH